jgi:hypothetical protein
MDKERRKERKTLRYVWNKLFYKPEDCKFSVIVSIGIYCMAYYNIKPTPFTYPNYISRHAKKCERICGHFEKRKD